MGGRIAWAKILQLHIERFMNFFKRVYIQYQNNQNENDVYAGAHLTYDEDITFKDQADQPPNGYQCVLQEFKKVGVETLYTRLREQLIRYQRDCLVPWSGEIQEIRMSLQSTVLVEHPKTKQLFVNFDPRISELCHEVKILQMLRVPSKEIPDAAKSMVLHEAKLSKYKDQLVEIINSIHTLMTGLHPETKDLMQPLVNKLNKRVQPLLRQVCWTSMNLPDYIEKIKDYISMVQETDSITKDILKNRVAKYLHEISEISFIPLYRRPTFNSPNDASQNSGHKSSPADDTEQNKDLTNHLERQHSIYLEANATNPQSYKKYLERSEPHKI